MARSSNWLGHGPFKAKITDSSSVRANYSDIIEQYIKERNPTATHKILVRRAIENYYKNPKLCINCNTVIYVNSNEKPGDLQDKKFCSHTCSAIYNNKIRGLKTRITICSKCEGKKDSTSNYCQKCSNDIYWELIKNKPIKDFYILGASRSKYNSIRTWARKLMARSNIEKKCFLCKYSEVIQVAHKKKISSFSDDTPIGIVNDIQNLMYLCPNEHILFDREK